MERSFEKHIHAHDRVGGKLMNEHEFMKHCATSCALKVLQQNRRSLVHPFIGRYSSSGAELELLHVAVVF